MALPGDLPLASWACLMDSTVCFMTPSSAATTNMTRSVMSAPRARMAWKAAWPGVSRNVIFSPDGMDTAEMGHILNQLKKMARFFINYHLPRGITNLYKICKLSTAAMSLIAR